ncbi:phosphoribosyltransferase [Nocardia thailandica]|uniref:phosphoribosyltransferase n=1 Tax=Nocardia thailandica TaxID=257275 RepID=UPI0002D3A04C|nr:phosphoribosyltransferase [Nocardia thailandica]
MTAPDTATPWATAHLGLTLHHGESFAGGQSVADLLEPGLRHNNPRRAHLLVSTVLGKHLPTDPRVVLDAGNRLGDLVREKLGAREPVVLGFAETATGLGHTVAARIGAGCYLHSTRRAVPTATTLTGFEEGHSHATSHLLQPAPADIFVNDLPLVLVDDEISTGDTALDAVRALHAFAPRAHYVLASLVDMRTAADRARFDAAAAELGARIDTVCLATGRTQLPEDLVGAVAGLPAPALNPVGCATGAHARVALPWPATVPEGGRHGILSSDVAAFEAALTEAAAVLRARLAADFAGRPVIVLGHEELMYLPLRLAGALADGGTPTRFQTTTRSPAYVLDRPGYPLRRGFRFTAPEPGEQAPRYLYNARWPEAEDDAVLVLVVDEPADTELLHAPGGLVDVLTAAGEDVLVAVLPGADPRALRDRRTPSAGGTARSFPEPLRGPDFGSYAPDEVAWLLQDLSEVDLEADVAERERRIQAGVAHYAESLPVEFQPDAAYRELFDEVLTASAERLALAVATVAELVVAQRGDDVVLVSLARAGTPVGVLMRRWLRYARGLEAPHYAVSIVRDRGIDAVALDYLAHHHDPSSIVFVDGWTGKGAITRELTEALDAYHAAGGARFDDELVVLADPGQCVRTYGTRDDFLIASACLNSTVSGLVSRTVLNDTLIGPGEFHGAKFYRELAADDVSNHLLDTVTAAFGTVRDRVAAAVAGIEASDRTPTWAGWASVEKVRAEYGVASVNFVKPGVGETTRVLLRRVPWRVLVREADAPEHAHIRLLARARGVPVEVVPDLAYSCMGLIKEIDQ